jgi:hypothetical protein
MAKLFFRENQRELIRSFPMLGSLRFENFFYFFSNTRSEPAFRFGDSAQDTPRLRSVVFEYAVVNPIGPGGGPLQLMKIAAIQG